MNYAGESGDFQPDREYFETITHFNIYTCVHVNVAGEWWDFQSDRAENHELVV